MGFASDTAQADAELAELVETEKQWQQKLEYATMNPSTTAQELRQLEDQLKRIAMAREELEERVKENHEHDDDPEEEEEAVSHAAQAHWSMQLQIFMFCLLACLLAQRQLTDQEIAEKERDDARALAEALKTQLKVAVRPRHTLCLIARAVFTSIVADSDIAIFWPLI